MKPQKIIFNKRTLAKLPLPSIGKRSVWHDESTKGLLIRVSSTGSKTFYAMRWVKSDGKPEWVNIGRFPETTIEQARKRVAEFNAVVAQGQNPKDVIRAARAEMTLQQLFDLYLERHAKVRKITWHEDLQMFNQYMKPLAEKRLSKITSSDIAALHARIGQSHKVRANRVLGIISTVFGRAREWHLIKENPTTAVRKFQEVARKRWVQPDEMPRFLQALDQLESEMARDFFLMAILTGIRRANVLAMRWEEINFERAEWAIPITKNGEPHVVTLSKMDMEILERRKQFATSPYVFPGNGKTGHYAEPKSAWRRVLKLSGLHDVRLHDLRHTLGSWLTISGAVPQITGKALGHKSMQSTTRYTHVDLDPVRRFKEIAQQAMFTLPVKNTKSISKNG